MNNTVVLDHAVPGITILLIHIKGVEMAIICRKFNLLFIMTPRTASSAIGHLLINEYEGEYIPKESIVDSNKHFLVQRKHSTLTQLIDYGLLSEKEVEGLLTFTTVRNPYDSIISLYTKKNKKYKRLLKNADSWVYQAKGYSEDMIYAQNHSFDAWLLKNYGKHIILRLLGKKPSMYKKFIRGVDEIIHFENLQCEFEKVLTKARVKKLVAIPVVNPTEGKNDCYQDYYSLYSKTLIAFVFRSDFIKYGYKF